MNATELYRYRGQGDAQCNHLKLIKDVFPVIKTTPCGYWIDVSHLGYIKGQLNNRGKKWVTNQGQRAFAYETEEGAIINFLARKDKHIRILKRQKSQAKAEREMMEQLAKDKNIPLPKRRY